MKVKRLIITFFMLLCLHISSIAVNLDSLKSKASEAVSFSKIDLIVQVADHYLKSNVDSAVYYSKLANRLSLSMNYNEGQVSSLNKLAFAYYIKNNTDSSKTIAKQALNISRRIEYNLGKAQSSNIIGLSEWRIGAYPKAVDHYLRALDYAILADNKIEIAKSNNYLGLVYWKTGDYPKSINYFFRSLEIKQELNDSYEIALTLNNLSNIHNEIGDYEQAIQFAKRALKISEQLDSKYTFGRALGNLGISYLKTKQTSLALEYLEKALKVKRESGEVKGLAYTLIDVGNIHFQLNDYVLAIKYYDESLAIMKEINDAHGLSIVLNKLSKILIQQNNLGSAKSVLDESNKYAKRENLKESIKENYLLYSQIFEKEGKTKQALKNHKFYSELKDSLVNENINSRIMELNINYETNQREKENELLKQSNRIQSLVLEKQSQYIYVLLIAALLGLFLISGIILRYNYLNKTKKITEQKNRKIELQKTELKQLNATKDKFFSILAHDLKNPFQTMLGYSTLLSTDYDELTETEKRSIIEQIANVSKSSYQLLDNLLSWANTQTGRIEYFATEVNLKELVVETLKPIKMQAERKEQNIELLVSPNIMALVDKNIFSTVLRNLITNAVKFSNTKGNIIIEATERKKDIVIKVEDDGRGIEEKGLSELFTLKTTKNSDGTASEKGTGLGLVICHEFVEIYKGEIWAESEYGKGSKFYFTIPKSNV